MNLKRFQELQDRINQARQQRDRATGALEQISKTIKDKWGCKSPTEASKLLSKMEKEANKLEQEAEEAADEFDQKFPEE